MNYCFEGLLIALIDTDYKKSGIVKNPYCKTITLITLTAFIALIDSDYKKCGNH